MSRINPFWCGPNPCEWHCEEGPLVCEEYQPTPIFSPGLPNWTILAESGTWSVVNNELVVEQQSSITLRLNRTAPPDVGRNIHASVGIRAAAFITYSTLRVWSCADETLTNGHWAYLDNGTGLQRTLTAGASAQEYSYTMFDTPSFAGVNHCVCDGWPGEAPPFDAPYAFISSAVQDNYAVTDPGFGNHMGFTVENTSVGGDSIRVDSVIFRPVLFPPSEPSLCAGCAIA